MTRDPRRFVLAALMAIAGGIPILILGRYFHIPGWLISFLGGCWGWYIATHMERKGWGL
jgi:hypothetical protein